MRRRDSICPWATAGLLMLVLSKHPALSLIIAVRQLHISRGPTHRPHRSCHLHPRATSCRSHTNDQCADYGLHRSAVGSIREGKQRRGLRRARSWMLDAADLKGQSISFASARAAPAAALRTAMDTYLPFGRLVGVELPVKITEEAMRVASAELMPEEVSYCLGLHPAMQLPFLGGRLAIRRALRDVGNKANTAITPADAGSSGVVTAPVPLDSTCGAILHNEAGAPLLPEGMSASISHKHHLAVALVQKAGAPGHLGVDIELPAVRRRADLRRRVLTQQEVDNLGGVSGLSEEEDVLLRFSMKEAVYKAAHPVLRRPLVFKDVEVQPKSDGSCEVHTTKPGAWGNLSLLAGWVRIEDVLGQPLLLTYCKAVESPQQ